MSRNGVNPFFRIVVLTRSVYRSSKKATTFGLN